MPIVIDHTNTRALLNTAIRAGQRDANEQDRRFGLAEGEARRREEETARNAEMDLMRFFEDMRQRTRTNEMNERSMRLREQQAQTDAGLMERQRSQEDATREYLSAVAEDVGMFRATGPESLTHGPPAGAESGGMAPGLRGVFEGMDPDSQKRAIDLYMQTEREQANQRMAEDALGVVQRSAEQLTRLAGESDPQAVMMARILAAEATPQNAVQVAKALREMTMGVIEKQQAAARREANTVPLLELGNQIKNPQQQALALAAVEGYRAGEGTFSSTLRAVAQAVADEEEPSTEGDVETFNTTIREIGAHNIDPAMLPILRHMWTRGDMPVTLWNRAVVNPQKKQDAMLKVAEKRYEMAVQRARFAVQAKKGVSDALKQVQEAELMLNNAMESGAAAGPGQAAPPPIDGETLKRFRSLTPEQKRRVAEEMTRETMRRLGGE